MIRLGLCCIFSVEPIKFKQTTAAACERLPAEDVPYKLASIIEANAAALREALEYCARTGIGCFRILSQILPLKTHPKFGYSIEDLPKGLELRQRFESCGEFAKKCGVRTVFHPDQFVVLSSPHPKVVSASLAEVEYQAQVARWCGADAITLHIGGGYGDKAAALKRFAKNAQLLSPWAKSLLAIENDDRTYTPEDVLALAASSNFPVVYDAHHHRCNRDRLTVKEATQAAISTWTREPLLHISSPREGWGGPNPERHGDYIRLRDFPRPWFDLDATVEVEAKAKEAAVLRLAAALGKKGVQLRAPRCR